MQERKSAILRAGLQVLREEGFAGFTQPRIAARAGLRQSHLTYYFPTRVDLLAAVARAAIDDQLSTTDRMFTQSSSPRISAGMAHAITLHENTRVLMGLAQAADHEPALRELFRELADGIAERAGTSLKLMDVPATQVNRDLLHALAVGLAVIDLATSRPEGEQRAKAVLDAAFRGLKRKA